MDGYLQPTRQDTAGPDRVDFKFRVLKQSLDTWGRRELPLMINLREGSSASAPSSASAGGRVAGGADEDGDDADDDENNNSGD